MSYQPLWTLKWVLDTILEYVSRLGGLANTFWTNWDIRATFLSWSTTAVTWTLTTVTTCSTLTNQTNIGWYLAQNHIPALMNLEATIWNTDNIYIS